MHHRQAADDQERDDGNHLDQREPELEFAVVAHVHEVDDDERNGDEKRIAPVRHHRKPAVQDLPGHIGFPAHQQGPEIPVQPADGEARPAPDGAVGVGGE
ncbi:hypothetical protein D3C87_1437770 [compost metagenome]